MLAVTMRSAAWSGGATGASGATLEGTALVLGQATPHAGVLAVLQRPLEADVDDRAPLADGLGLFDLRQGRTGVADGEEQLGVFGQTCGIVAPVHGNSSGTGIGPHRCNVDVAGLRRKLDTVN